MRLSPVLAAVPEWTKTSQSGRVDYQWNDKHSLFGRYMEARRDSPSDFDGENVLSIRTGYSNQRVYSFALRRHLSDRCKCCKFVPWSSEPHKHP